MMRVTEGSAIRGQPWPACRPTRPGWPTLQAQMSSGRQITKPSDNPTGTVTALQLRSQLTQANQYQANANDALGWLTTVDSTYSSITSQLQQVRSLVLQGMNTGTGNATSNEALAQQVDQARASLLSLANSSYLGRPVFGGTTAGSVAFDATGSLRRRHRHGDPDGRRRTALGRPEHPGHHDLRPQRQQPVRPADRHLQRPAHQPVRRSAPT